MTDLVTLFPRQLVPTLKVPVAGDGMFDLGAEAPEHFTLIVFYRGLHCPICKLQLTDLQRKLPDFAQRGVGVIAISSDNEARAFETKTNWGLDALRLGYGFDLATARKWGLFVSTGRGKTSIGVEEPARFSEPAIYLVRPDGTLYFSSVQTMPFARPHFSDILAAIDMVVAKSYPARGEIETL